MGQYHTPYCIDTRTALLPADMDCFTKALELLHGPTVTAAITLMCAAGFPESAFPKKDMPRGAWAGKRVLLMGDYADKRDLRGEPFASHPATDGTIYGTVYKHKTTRIKAKASSPKSVGAAVLPHVEHLMEQAGSTTPNMDGRQEAGLWVSLDAGEYVDTAAFGAHDLLSAIDQDGWRPFLISALVQPGVRGGGDLHGDHGLGAIGRWRGDRIVFLGPEGASIKGKRLTQAHVRATMADISGLARFVQSLHAEDDNARTRARVVWENEGGEEHAIATALAHAPGLHDTLLRIVAEHWPELRAPEEEGDTKPRALPTLVVRPTTLVEVKDGGHKVRHRFLLPFQATLEDSDDGRFWMTPDLRAALKKALDVQSPVYWQLRTQRNKITSRYTRGTWTEQVTHIGWGPTRCVRLPALTAHTRLSLEAALA